MTFYTSWDKLESYQRGAILCIIDVVGLYPHIPHNEGLEALKEALGNLEGHVESEQQGSLNEDILSFAELLLKSKTLSLMVEIIFKNEEQR